MLQKKSYSSVGKPPVTKINANHKSVKLKKVDNGNTRTMFEICFRTPRFLLMQLKALNSLQKMGF